MWEIQSSPQELGIGSSRHLSERVSDGPGCLFDVLFISAEVESTKGSKKARFEQVHLGSFLGFVGCNRGISGGMALEHVEGLPLEDEVTVAHAVDQHGVVRLGARDDLRRLDPRRQALFSYSQQRERPFTW